MSSLPAAKVERLISQAQAGERLDRALAGLLPGCSPARVAKLIRQGAVTCAGRTILRSNQKAALGQSYVLRMPVAEAALAQLEALVEDEHLLAVAKPPGLLTHGTGRSQEPSLADYAEARWGPLPRDAGDERPGIVHRLDRDTSGLIVIARHSACMAALRDAFRQRNVRKHYLALVQGTPAQAEWTIDAPLAAIDASNPRDRDRQRVDPRGKQAQTTFRVLSQHGPFTWVACTPLTGRRHQIRVHLAESGLFIAGDPLYRHPSPASGGPKRLALHAEALALTHPISGQAWSAHCALAKDLWTWCGPQLPSTLEADGIESDRDPPSW